MRSPFAYSRWLINTKLLLIITGLLIAALGSMIFLATHFFRGDTEAKIREKNQQLSKLLAASAAQELGAVLTSLNLAAELLPAAEERPTGEAARFLDRILRNDSRLLTLSITPVDAALRGAKSLHRENSQQAPGPLTAEARERLAGGLSKFLPAARAGETVIANVSDLAQAPVMAVLVPFQRSTEGAVVSVAQGLFRLDGIQTLFSRTSAGDIAEVFMVDGKGEVLAHADPRLVLARADLSSVPIVAALLKSPVGNGQRTYEDAQGRHLATFWKTGVAGLGVVATVPERLAYREVERIQRRNLYLAAIVLGIAVLLTFFFARTLSIPLVALARATEEIDAGRYQVRVEPHNEDEIGILGRSFNHMAKGLEDKERLRETLGRFANREVAEQALRGELTLGGERREVAILFSDIRSFTAISERLEPEEVVEFLNRYLTLMEACVTATHGVVDKYIGDAVMAIWGAPKQVGNSAQNAVDGALAMRKALSDFNRDRGGPHKPVIRIGIGIHIGPVLAGQIGSENHIAYTVIGDAVNLASRVETLCKPFGADILVSDETRQRLPPGYRLAPMQKIKVKGKAEAQQIHAVLGREEDPDAPATIEALRALLGTNAVMDADVDKEEVKYEVLGEDGSA